MNNQIDVYTIGFTKKNAEEFFGFIRSLEAYRNTFKDKNDVMVLSPKSEFFNYMKDAKAN